MGERVRRTQKEILKDKLAKVNGDLEKASAAVKKLKSERAQLEKELEELEISQVAELMKRKSITAEELQDLADFFKVFGDSTRIRVLWALGHAEMCVCDIAVLLNMTKSAISHQLRVLRESNLVKTRRDGKVVYYSLADHHVKEIFEKAVEHLEESCD